MDANVNRKAVAEMAELNWTEAIEHLNTMKQACMGIPPQSSWFYLAQIRKLEARWDDGERTKELYDEIMAMD